MENLESDPDCRLYSRKPERMWRHSHSPREWFEPGARPEAWIHRREETPSQRRSPAVEQELETAKRLLALPDNWDDEGAKRISNATWELATGFLRRSADRFFRRFGEDLPGPKIGPCADGSIDILWRGKDFKLLVNIQPGESGNSDFYGENARGLKLKGTFSQDDTELTFLEWLASP